MTRPAQPNKNIQTIPFVFPSSCPSVRVASGLLRFVKSFTHLSPSRIRSIICGGVYAVAVRSYTKRQWASSARDRAQPADHFRTEASSSSTSLPPLLRNTGGSRYAVVLDRLGEARAFQNNQPSESDMTVLSSNDKPESSPSDVDGSPQSSKRGSIRDNWFGTS